MINKEVVVFQIEDMLSNINKENLLSFGGHIDNGAAFLELMTNVLTLLKEKEAVKPTFKQDNDGIFVWACGSCGAYMYHIYEGIDKAKEYAKYCRQCGRKVKWE